MTDEELLKVQAHSFSALVQVYGSLAQLYAVLLPYIESRVLHGDDDAKDSLAALENAVSHSFKLKDALERISTLLDPNRNG